jgi:Na+/proline symporter
MAPIAAFLLIIALLFIFFIQAARASKRNKLNHPHSYFLSAGQHSKEEYGMSQVAYFLQMATVFPFFYYSYLGMWWLAVWNIIFYALGIILFFFMLPKTNSKALSLATNAKTLHAMIANLHNEPKIRIICSWFSIIAFLGLALFEIVWGATALRAIFDGSSFVYNLSIIILGVYLILFIWSGGQRAALKTDQYQILIAYIGLHLMTAWLLYHHPNALSEIDSPVIFLLIVTFSAVTVLMRIIKIKQDGKLQMQIINLLAIASLVILVFSIVKDPVFSSSTIFKFKFEGLEFNLNSMMPLLSFAILPLLYQFVDVTNWQRLSSLDTSETNFISDAKSGLKTFLIESPLSWLLPVALGIVSATFLVVEDSGNPWFEFLKHIASLDTTFGIIVAAFGLAGIVAIFLSTADALLTACGYIYAYDLNSRTSAITDKIKDSNDFSSFTEAEGADVVRTGKRFISAAVFLSIVGFVLLNSLIENSGASLIGLFLAFYTPMIAFAPSIIVPLMTGKRISSRYSLASIVVGAVGGLLVGFYYLIFATDPIWEYLSVPVAVISSSGIYLIAFAFNRISVE